jgi:septal ring factor EnvC (AmiA/AmiB activator)
MLLLLYLLSWCPVSLANVAMENPQKIEKDIKQLNQQISRIQQSLSQKVDQRDQISKELSKLEKNISKTAKQVHWLNKERNELKRQLKQKQQRKRELLREKSANEQALSQQVRSAYFSGRQEYIKLLLNQEQPEKLGRLLAYYNYLNKARISNIDKLGATIRELIDVEQVIQQKAEQMEKLHEQQQRELTELNQQKAQRDRFLSNLNQQISSNDARLGNLKENQSQLSELLDGIRHILKQRNLSARNAKFAALKGKLRWPVQGKVINTFRSSSNRIHSNGVVIRANEGDIVTSVHQGRVIFADWLRGFGLLVIVDHGDGYMSLYGHNQSVFKNPGDWIEAGEAIGSVGISGGQLNSGLYFDT